MDTTAAGPRPRKLRIAQPAASGRPRSLRCSSSPLVAASFISFASPQSGKAHSFHCGSSPHKRRTAFRGDPVFASLGFGGDPIRDAFFSTKSPYNVENQPGTNCSRLVLLCISDYSSSSLRTATAA
ncbi:hypothetical protein BACCAP_00443 [Pseudoflavonifractor capillosus ATCC 29799]|uniref:Uncharacterized protein n=1 Tax=Pseudoflavonifractor capillosus ATCC 29799 TaxID=411467 RepID=A6NQH3_9FIRM|nr:hypothetical protein BACCAP_00443 [Pseudoflavonifractor capillosus ATCC 29799]